MCSDSNTVVSIFNLCFFIERTKIRERDTYNTREYLNREKLIVIIMTTRFFVKELIAK